MCFRINRITVCNERITNIYSRALVFKLLIISLAKDLLVASCSKFVVQITLNAM